MTEAVGAAAAAAAGARPSQGLQPPPSELRAVCFDWGGTLMADDGPADRPMVDWPQVTVLPGAAELLRGLHGRWRICLATNAAQSSRAQIESALQRAGLRPWIDEIFCARELGLRKEQPAFWSTVAERLGLRPEQIAMLGDPPVLVLDEVTASLDACGRGAFVSLLSRLSGTGRTLLFASHRVEEIAALAKRVVVLDKGKVSLVTDASRFTGDLGSDTTLHLTIRSEARTPAMDALRAGGFAPRLNGVGLLVPVSTDQKAAPFRVLADASIRIDDFELLQSAAGAGHTHTEEKQ